VAIPKYARLEMERRWLVDPARLPDLSGRPYRRIEDLYLEGRLRLRAITDGRTGAREFKLGKKYERTDPLGGPITSLYLTQAEHAAFAGLPGARLVKRRYALDGFSLDVFEGRHEGLVLAEVERESAAEAAAIAAPPWAGVEITDDPAYSGWALAQRPAAS
jgi:CYTH domain-containing protein